MGITKLFALIALAGSIVLLNVKSFKLDSLKSLQGILPFVAVVASALEIVIVFNLMNIPFLGSNAFLILGGALAVAGGLIFKNVSGKLMTASATLITFIGALQALSSFGIIPKF